MTGAWRGTLREKLYAELGWEKLNACRWGRRLVLLYKFLHNLTPEYTTNPILPLRQSQYSLGNQDAIGWTRARTEKIQSSFYSDCLSEGNNLDQKTRLSPSISVFKTKLLSEIRSAPKSVFKIHDPTGLYYILHNLESVLVN